VELTRWGAGERLPEELEAGLRRSAGRRGVFGEPLHYFHETGSTNDVAARLADAGAPEGTTVVALAQTAGRGRLGRSWFSPPGAGLYISVVCRNRVAAPYLTLGGAVAVADGIRQATGLPVEIKWPNDILAPRAGVRAPRLKIAGILAEASSGPAGVQHVVLGVGINLQPAAYPPDIAARASSIETELGRPPDAGAVLGESLAALSAVHAQLAAGRSADVLERWQALAPDVRGATVEWDTPTGRRTGTTAGIDDAGALLVRTSEGLERIISGELRWLS
jgi:BirA family transcriptional regulator, biotin operon repressor / biotin---[acetyl-CoA-carboxylase] ligase